MLDGQWLQYDLCRCKTEFECGVYLLAGWVLHTMSQDVHWKKEE